jgi:HlyD family secretion protein
VGSSWTKLATVILALLTMAAFSGCSRDQAAGAQSDSPSVQPARAVPSAPAKTSAAPTTVSTPSANPASIVRGSGTVAAATDSKLNFATAGKIDSVAVKQGDKVANGSFLVKLDTTSLESTLALARVTLDQALLAQTQAQTALASAQFTLDKTRSISDIKDLITNLQWQIKIGELNMAAAQSANDANSSGYWSKMVANYRLDLAKKNKDLSDLLGKVEYTGTITYDIMGQKYDRLTVEDMKMKQLQVDAAQKTLDKSQSSIDQAQKNLALAQQQLNDATIFAPFNGIVATLDVKEGDVVPAPTQSSKPIVYFIDPTSMQIDVGVNELDVPKVKVGQPAAVKVDAFPALVFEGKVTAISPMPVVQGGVVDYPVTVTFTVSPNIEIKVGMNGTGAITTK